VLAEVTPFTRPAAPEDLRQLLRLFGQHAAYEGASFKKEDKEKKLGELIFQTKEIKCYVAIVNDQIVGYTTFFKQLSSWNAAWYTYMDCIFLKEEVRNMGIGPMLLNHVREFAIAEGCTSIEWQTPYFNKRAINFYTRIGAEGKEKVRFSLSRLENKL